MPECVEVEAVATKLRVQLADASLCWVHRSELASTTAVPAMSIMALRLPAKVAQVTAHAKELHFALQSGQYLVLHFMLEGKLQTLVNKRPRGCEEDDPTEPSMLTAACFDQTIVNSASTIATLHFVVREQSITFAVIDVRFMAKMSEMDASEYAKHARNFAPALWRPVTENSVPMGHGQLLPLLSRSQFTKRCHALSSKRSVADVLKDQRGQHAICSGLGQWLVWQLCVAIACETNASFTDTIGQGCVAAKSQKQAASIQSFFRKSASGSTSSQDENDCKRRKLVHSNMNNNTETCKTVHMYDTMQRLANNLYSKLLKLETVDDIFREYKTIRRSLLQSGQHAPAFMLATVTATTSPLPLTSSIVLSTPTATGMCVSMREIVDATEETGVVNSP